jgi:hypothetical protein
MDPCPTSRIATHRAGRPTRAQGLIVVAGAGAGGDQCRRALNDLRDRVAKARNVEGERTDRQSRGQGRMGARSENGEMR